MKVSRRMLWAVFGAIAALLVGYTVEDTRGTSLIEWMFDDRSRDSFSWVVWMAAGAVLGGVGYTLINRDNTQP